MNILITGAGSVMGQSIYKALSKCDKQDEVRIHFANSNTLAAGRYFSGRTAPIVKAPIFPLASEPNYKYFLEKYVDEHQIDIVFPGTQHELTKLAKFRDKTMKVASIPSSIVEICMDKVRTSAVLSKHDIRVPKTCTFSEFLQSADLEGPIVVKPNHSSSSRNIFRLNDKQQASKLDINPHAFLVQEHLLGEEYTCGLYIDRFTKRYTHIVFKRLLSPDGASLYGEIVNDPDISRYIVNIGDALVKEGLDFGHVNIQLILTDKGPVLFEINGRLSSTEASKAYYGFNSCAAFVTNIVMQKPYSKWQIAQSGKFLRYYEETYFDE
ncbi:ATP-grasp domain-containing protein [Hoeflea sp. TYP-13]|uniref:ATP-grasp domain-containing protein n=1 Tax=Hoeflea sp. TYP-13 TaxID=3230023 RepID=UPI0034C698C2